MTAADAKLTADAAKAISDSMENERAKKEISELETKIRTSAEAGVYSTTVYKSLMNQVTKELEKRGFKVKSSYDSRDGDSWTTISW